MVTHLLMDKARANRIAGAVGFNVRTGNYHVFKSKAVICGAGGASNIFKPRSTGEGAGRTWYAPWSSASAYGLMINAGAKIAYNFNRSFAVVLSPQGDIAFSKKSELTTTNAWVWPFTAGFRANF